MLFHPTYNIEILQEAEYKVRIAEIEAALKECMHSGIHESFDGCKLYYEYFLAENSRGNIVIVHGFTEFIKKYYEMAWYFLNMGFNVFCFDLRGHGLSGRYVEDPQIVHIEDFEQYALDLDSFIEGIVVPNGEGKEIMLYGHSMGAAVAMMYIFAEKREIRRCALSSPMILPKTHGIPASLVRTLVKREGEKNGWMQPFKFAGKFSENPDFSLSNDLSRARFDYQLDLRIGEPKYQTSTATNRWIYESVCVEKQLHQLAAARKSRCKMLIIGAENDTTVHTSAQRRIAKHIPKAKYVCFGNAKHTIYNGTTEMISRYVDLIVGLFTGPAD